VFSPTELAGIGVNNHGIDFVTMSRPLILEPDLISKYESGESKVSRCIDCNCCIIGVHQRPLRCYYGKVDKR